MKLLYDIDIFGASSFKYHMFERRLKNKEKKRLATWKNQEGGKKKHNKYIIFHII